MVISSLFFIASECTQVYSELSFLTLCESSPPLLFCTGTRGVTVSPRLHWKNEWCPSWLRPCKGDLVEEERISSNRGHRLINRHLTLRDLRTLLIVR